MPRANVRVDGAAAGDGDSVSTLSSTAALAVVAFIALALLAAVVSEND